MRYTHTVDVAAGRLYTAVTVTNTRPDFLKGRRTEGEGGMTTRKFLPDEESRVIAPGTGYGWSNSPGQ